MIDDSRYNTPAKRLENGDEVDRIVADWIRSQPLQLVLAVLEDYEVPITPVYDIAQITEDPQYQARETIISLEDEDLGTIRMANIPPRFSRTPGRIRYSGRTEIGYDTLEILHSIGISESEIRDLCDKDIIRVVEPKTK
jgi:formyl-CoA transferase